MFGIAFDELVFISVIFGIPLLIALRVYIPATRASRGSEVVGEVNLIQEWASVRDAWRDRDLLVVRDGASLPGRCIVTNRPEGRWVTLRMYWHPPALYLAIFGGLWLYAILALLLRQRLDVHVAVSEEVLNRRRLAFWSSVLIGAFGFAAAFISAGDPTTFWGASGALLVLVAVAVWVWGSRMVRAVRIESGYAWLKGVHPDYLITLPSFTGVSLETPGHQVPNKRIEPTA